MADLSSMLDSLSKGDLKVVNKLKRTLEESYEESGLDQETFMLVRMAALVAMDASPASWLANLKMGKELGIDPDRAIGTLRAIAPVVGTVHTIAAAGNIIKALDMAEEMQEAMEGTS